MVRKIIHIDMDCFYAAIEMRDNPELQGLPIAVGGQADKRGVLSTCNYEARQYGLHSAMPTYLALRQCPKLILLPTNMEKYRQVSQDIREIFYQYTDLVEPLSLDEAYLDVSACTEHAGSATWIAEAIRARIWEQLHLAASAGVAPNKFLAKVASDWKKPNGQFVIPPEAVAPFIKELPVKKIHGVGPVTAEKLKRIGIESCEQLQKHGLQRLKEQFGCFGEKLYAYARGEDERPVKTQRLSKSLSVERTFAEDLKDFSLCLNEMMTLFNKLTTRLAQKAGQRKIRGVFVKVKFSNFEQTTAEQMHISLQLDVFSSLLKEAWERQKQAVRLIGIGVRFGEKEEASFQLPFSFE